MEPVRFNHDLKERSHQVLVNLALLPTDVQDACQSVLSYVSEMWQSVDALALQHLDVLPSLGVDALAIMKDTRMRDVLLASRSASNGM